MRLEVVGEPLVDVVEAVAGEPIGVPSPPERRRRAGVVRDSIARKSEMSEIPFWTVSGVIPCSLL